MNVSVKDGKLLVRCFATCPQLDLIGTLREKHLWPESREFKPSPQLQPVTPVITKHPYYNEHGDLVAVHVRKDFGSGRKSMPWELPDGRISTNGDINTANLPLYGLPNVLERLDKAVILVEGEKAADAAMAEGLVAVSLSGGANQPDFGQALESLRGRHVLLWPDNDKPGLDLMLRVKQKLEGIAARIQWLVVPGLPIKGDAADYFAADRTVEDLHNYVFDRAPSQAEEQPVPARRFVFVTADELKNRPDPEWIVDDLIQRDTLALIVGAQETYKSFLALDLAMSVAEGHTWQGKACKPGTAVYVSAEGGSGLGLRVSAWEVARNTPSKHCLFLSDQAPQFLDGRKDGDVEELLLSLAELDHQPVLVIVDTLARVMVGHDENSVEDMGLLIATADRIRQLTGATVIFIHHNNKQGSARGSTALLGAVHTIVECSREQNSNHVVVRCGKQKDADHFATMILEAKMINLGRNEESGQERTSLVLDVKAPQFMQALQRSQLKPTSIQALDALISLGTANFAQWRDTAGLAKTTFHDARQELINLRYVDHLVDGMYAATDMGKSIGSVGSVEGRPTSDRPRVDDEVGRVGRGSVWGGPLREGPHRPTDPPISDPDPLPWSQPEQEPA